MARVEALYVHPAPPHAQVAEAAPLQFPQREVRRAEVEVGLVVHPAQELPHRFAEGAQPPARNEAGQVGLVRGSDRDTQFVGVAQAHQPQRHRVEDVDQIRVKGDQVVAHVHDGRHQPEFRIDGKRDGRQPDDRSLCVPGRTARGGKQDCPMSSPRQVFQKTAEGVDHAIGLGEKNFGKQGYAHRHFNPRKHAPPQPVRGATA